MSNRNLFTGMRLADVAIFIDNQAQLTSSASYTTADAKAIHRARSASAELQCGNANINAIRSNHEPCCKRSSKTPEDRRLHDEQWVVTFRVGIGKRARLALQE
jgi:hypothetical protein